jgi:uncharacterized protein (TIGR03435 family)
MNSVLVRLAANCVRVWTRVYTGGMPPTCREDRRAEIESDLWEFQCDAAGDHAFAVASHILLRLLIGVPDDLGWRVERAAVAATLTQRSLALSGRVAGAALCICALWAISADAHRRRPATAVAGSAAVFNQDIEEARTMRAGNVPRFAGRRVPGLTAGLMAALGVSLVPQLAAQAPPTAIGGPAFEAASVKPNKSGDARSILVPQAGGRLTGTNVTAAELIRFAYGLPDFQISGGPNWLSADRFDIVAKADSDASVDQKRLMLRGLLAERFKLTAHIETRELPIYALVIARSDRRIGPQLRRTEADCAHATPPAFLGIGPSPSNGPPACGFFGMAAGTDFRAGRGGFAFRGLTMAALAKTLVPMVHRSVSDQTGLNGYFDAEFDFLAEIGPPPPPPGLPDPFDRASFLSVFTVLPEQLGLKLDSRRGPVEVLVIDHAEQPTPD